MQQPHVQLAAVIAQSSQDRQQSKKKSWCKERLKKLATDKQASFEPAVVFFRIDQLSLPFLLFTFFFRLFGSRCWLFFRRGTETSVTSQLNLGKTLVTIVGSWDSSFFSSLFYVVVSLISPSCFFLFPSTSFDHKALSL